MSIKLYNTKSFGQIIGDVEDTLDGTTIKIIKPAYIQLQQTQQGELGVAMMGIMTPFVDGSSEDYIVLGKEDIIGGILDGYKPNEGVYNEYQKRFGSGFTLHTSPLIK